jgi:hypothetical protein
MITAKDACMCTHKSREKAISAIKAKIEAHILQCIETGDFEAKIYCGNNFDISQEEEISTYLTNLGYDVESCTRFDNETVLKFSWLVD